MKESPAPVVSATSLFARAHAWHSTTPATTTSLLLRSPLLLLAAGPYRDAFAASAFWEAARLAAATTAAWAAAALRPALYLSLTGPEECATRGLWMGMPLLLMQSGADAALVDAELMDALADAGMLLARSWLVRLVIKSSRLCCGMSGCRGSLTCNTSNDVSALCVTCVWGMHVPNHKCLHDARPG